MTTAIAESGVETIDVCIDEGGTDADVTVYVANYGQSGNSVEVEVDVTDTVLDCDEGNNVVEIPGPIAVGGKTAREFPTETAPHGSYVTLKLLYIGPTCPR